MKYTLEVTKKQFKNESGDLVDYNSFTVEVAGNKFNLVPRTEDKKLLNYLIEQELKKEQVRGAKV